MDVIKTYRGAYAWPGGKLIRPRGCGLDSAAVAALDLLNRPLRLALAALLLAAIAGGCAAPSRATTQVTQATAAEAPPSTPPSPALPSPAGWADEILYFVLVDRFADGDPTNNAGVDRTAPGAFHGGDLKGLLQHLDEIAELGVTALWINPLVKNIDGFVTGSGMPDWGYHGYWADDFSRLDPRFGTEEDLRALVEACHRRGIKVLLDVVYNHAGYGSRFLTDPRTKGWLRSNETGTCGEDDLTTCVAGLPDFKTELPEVASFLLDAQLDWAKRSGVDGFRLDTVKHLDHPFWQEHRRRTREQLGAGFFLLGEVWGGDPEVLKPWFEPDEVDAGFDFSFQGSALAYVMGRGRTVAFDRYLKTRRTTPNHHLAHFLSSHDVTGALFQLGGDKALFRLAVVLQLTTVGIPTVYYGEEVGRLGGAWPENRSDMPWGDRNILPGAGQPRDESLRDLYRTLIAIRRTHPALSRGPHQGVSTDGDLYAFLRGDLDSRDAVVVVLNRGAQPATLSFTPPEDWGEAPVKDLLGGEEFARTGEKLELPVAPRAARILAVK